MRRPGRPRGENRDSNHLDVVPLLRRLLGHGALRAEGGGYVLTAEGQALSEAKPSIAPSCDAALPVTGCSRMAKT